MENSYKYFENKKCKYFPCHKYNGDFNCMFCFCPMYKLDNCPGNPSYIERGDKNIMDCSNCVFPHIPDNYDKIMEILRSEK